MSNEIWNKFLELVNIRVSSISYQTWFKNLKLHSIDSENIILMVPFEAHKNQLINVYYALIE